MAQHRRPVVVSVGHRTYRQQTGEPLLDLVAAVFRRAVRDASTGKVSAAAMRDAESFLNVTFPEWRKFQEGMTNDE